MSFSRSSYDHCEYKSNLTQRTGTLSYLLDPVRYYHHEPRRVPFGFTAGNEVSLSRQNLVDLESDLQGRTRLLSRCPKEKYHPCCKKGCTGDKGIPCSDKCKCNCRSKLIHMKESFPIKYGPRRGVKN